MSSEVAQLSRKRQIFIASAPCIVWWAGVMQICGTGFILPSIQERLKSTDAQVQWVNSSFNITWGCFALVAGRIADIQGIRKSYILGLSWYSLWICISAFMPNVIGLSTARGLAGIGYAITTPCGSALVATHIPEGAMRTRSFAAMAGSGAIGAGMGWALGGVFAGVTKHGWRILHVVVSVPLIYSILIGVLVVPADQPHPHDRRVDWFGAGAITATQILLNSAFTLSVSQERQWEAPYVPALLATAMTLLALFVWWQIRLDRGDGPPPLTPRRLVTKDRNQLIPLYISAILVFIKVDNLTVTGAYFYSKVLRLKSIESGIRVMPAVAAGLITSIIVGLSLSRIPARALLTSVDIIGGFCGVICAVRSISTPYWKSDLWAWLLDGCASDGTTAVGSVLIARVTDPGDQAVGSALFVTFSRFGASLGLSLVTMIRESVRMKDTNGRTWEDERDAVWKGIQAAFLFTAACGFAAGLVVLCLMRGWDVVGKHTGEQLDAQGETDCDEDRRDCMA